MNKFVFMGRLTKDPELKQTPNGISVTRFSVALKRRFAKEGQQQADFINCTAWRQTAEFVSKYFKKGDMIAGEGEVQSRSWDGDNGQKNFAIEVVVSDVEFAGSKNGSGTSEDNQQGNTYANQKNGSQANYGGSAKSSAANASGFDDFMDIGDEVIDDVPF